MPIVFLLKIDEKTRNPHGAYEGDKGDEPFGFEHDV
jgi:hypothetical protein